MKSNNIGQSAIELLILVGAVIFFVVGFLIAVQINVGDRTRENKNKILNEVAFTLQDEINIAQKAPDGYLREFRLSPTILTSEYNITLSETGLIYVTTEDGRYATAVSAPPVMGEAITGDNTIRSERGKVCINVPFDACFACGDGDVDTGFPDYDGEECDGSDIPDPLCETVLPGYTGNIKCRLDCKYDTSNCVPI